MAGWTVIFDFIFVQALICCFFRFDCIFIELKLFCISSWYDERIGFYNHSYCGIYLFLDLYFQAYYLLLLCRERGNVFLFEKKIADFAFHIFHTHYSSCIVIPIFFMRKHAFIFCATPSRNL